MIFTCIDAFCGAGGLSLGLQQAGYKILYSFDNNQQAINTIINNRKYFSHKAEKIDIESLSNGRIFEKVEIKPRELFLLAGGPPCQGFSVQRIGEDYDARNDLIFKFFNLLLELMPYYFLIENVPGITGKRGKNVLNSFIEKVTGSEYRVKILKLDAQDFNIPQRRKRVFVLGERMDINSPFFLTSEPQKDIEKVTVRMAIGVLPHPPEDGRDHPDISLHRRDKLSDINKLRLMELKPGQGRDYLPNELLAECHKTPSSKIGHRNVYGRMKWDDVAPTITARFDSFTRGQFGHPDQIRTISLREGAILQTFPIDYIFCGNKVQIANQIGNAVPVKLAKKVGDHIIDIFKDGQR